MPAKFKVSEVIAIIRKNLNMGRDQGIFLLAQGKVIMKGGEELTRVYERFHDEDGFLYITYALESVVG